VSPIFEFRPDASGSIFAFLDPQGCPAMRHLSQSAEANQEEAAPFPRRKDAPPQTKSAPEGLATRGTRCHHLTAVVDSGI